jgi:CHASE2 domain-containing sensor protein
LAIAALSAMTFLRAADPAPIAQMRERTFDAYQKIRPRAYNPDMPVRIVDIDEASLAAIGQWPWSRDVVSSLVRRLSELGAGVIAFDVTPRRYCPACRILTGPSWPRSNRPRWCSVSRQPASQTTSAQASRPPLR